MTPPPEIAVLASIDPDGPEATVAASVLRRELAERLGPVSILLATTIDVPASFRRRSWRPATTHELRSANAVIVDAHVPRELRDELLDGIDGAHIVETTLLAGSLAPLLARQIDPIALDVRQRMLRHLGVVPAEPAALAELPDLPLTAADMAAIVAASTEVRIADATLRAIEHPGPTGPLDAELDRIAAAVAPTLPETPDVRAAELVARIQRLSLELAEQNADRRRLTEECARLQGELDVVTERLERRTVRADLDDTVDDRTDEVPADDAPDAGADTVRSDGRQPGR